MADRSAGGEMEVGVISDTHGLLRPQAIEALAGCELILHAGDVGSQAVLDGLREIAPVLAIRGNVDKGEWAAELPATRQERIAGALVYLLHDEKQLDLDPCEAGIGVVISGHSHRFAQRRVNGVLYLNPGSAGPRRFKLPITLARLCVDRGELSVTPIDLLV